MKNFLEASTIKHSCHAELQLGVIADAGIPTFSVLLDDHEIYKNNPKKSCNLRFSFDIAEMFNIEFLLANKKYMQNKETAVVIERFTVDGLEVLPRFNHHFQYINDHKENITTNYMGYNGSLILRANDNFYMWYHTATDQGMLLRP